MKRRMLEYGMNWRNKQIAMNRMIDLSKEKFSSDLTGVFSGEGTLVLNQGTRMCVFYIGKDDKYLALETKQYRDYTLDLIRTFSKHAKMGRCDVSYVNNMIMSVNQYSELEKALEENGEELFTETIMNIGITRSLVEVSNRHGIYRDVVNYAEYFANVIDDGMLEGIPKQDMEKVDELNSSVEALLTSIDILLESNNKRVKDLF